MSFRLRVVGMLAATVTVFAAGCASTAPAPDAVSAAFTGKSYVLLGEVHDNAAAQQQRLAALKRAVEQGWRPAIAMEQFDRERQADIERARRERPRDADYLIAQAGGGAWQWPLYRPVVALALEYDLPLVAANLSRADAGKIVRGGLDGLFSADERRQLGLDGALPPDLVSAQTAVLDRGHCGNFPKAMLPGMLSAQAARDAVMAQVLRPHAQRGAVLVAGNGHVRRDIGVPRWLAADAGKVLSVGYVENPPGDGEFDMAVVVPAVERKDPCLQARPAGSGGF
ncbi:ChaN family lipoprotein [Cupriavidus necator]|uniref:ChaN family lipoprotein n=1 Tax=Cupriavidus necator TaxID=106590 RepID=UPI0005B304BB|nr:ChaN family lipoprotein [Cupriavidus necator]